MQVISITVIYGNKGYRLHSLLGLLLEKDDIEYDKNMPLLKKIEKTYEKVINPYLLLPNNKPSKDKLIVLRYAKLIAQLYTYLCTKSFLFVRLLSFFRFNIFNSSEEAIIFYRNNIKENQPNLCLPRALFAACTSRAFRDKGAMFIGVFLPTRQMHAWVIENDKQPDWYDDIWICYQPVAVMYRY